MVMILKLISDSRNQLAGLRELVQLTRAFNKRGKEETMGYYEGWDNVWCNDVQVGWICPRCERFVQRGEEHSCEAVEPEQQIQVLETWWKESSQHIRAR